MRNIDALSGKPESNWAKCEGWFPDTWSKSRTCGKPSRTAGSKLCDCCSSRKTRYKDPEATKAKRREYYKNNPQKFKDYAYDDYWKNRDDRLLRSALYYQQNADKICSKKKEIRANAKQLEQAVVLNQGQPCEEG